MDKNLVPVLTGSIISGTTNDVIDPYYATIGIPDDVMNPYSATIEPIPAKPIFMIGMPSSMNPDSLWRTQKELEKKLSDYHVLVLHNTTDTYTAKLFSEKGDDTMDISEIKRYIKQKLRQ